MVASRFGYEGKRVLVVGGATGMGAAAAKGVAELGAEVTVMDVAAIDYPCAQDLQVDLRDKRSVDAAISAIDAPIHAIFSCAGVADGPDLMSINFIAQRHLIDRLLEQEKLSRGGSIAMISSAAGMGWRANLDQTLDFLSCEDWESAAKWIESNPETNNYLFSKQVMNTYVARESPRLLQRGVRLNSILPGPTDTPLARANADTWLTFGEPFRKQVGVEALSPEQIGDSLIFLCSEAAGGINGATIIIDYGHTNAALSGAYEDPMIRALLGAS